MKSIKNNVYDKVSTGVAFQIIDKINDQITMKWFYDQMVILLHRQVVDQSWLTISDQIHLL